MNVRFLLIVAAMVAAGSLIAGTAYAMATASPPPPLPAGVKPLTGAKLAWLQELARDAGPVLRAAGLPLSVAFGQAAVETGWGTAGARNPWGLRGSGDAGSDLITTHEVINLQKVEQKKQKFAAFSSHAAAAAGYAKFLTGKSYRPGKANLPADPGAWLLWLWSMGYATSTHYAAAVVDASRKIAASLGDLDLQVHPWTPQHAAKAKALSEVAAGSARRQLVGTLVAHAAIA